MRAPMRGAAPKMHSDPLPRLVAGYRPDVPVTLEEHLDHYGAPPWPRRRDRHAFVDMIERSGLRGRGGASFPTGRKLRTVAAGRRPVVVANGSEGEPASSKDKLLMTGFPHLVLDGAMLAALAVGATEVVVAVDRAAHPTLASISGAIEARRSAGLDPVPVRLVHVPTRYVAGEETALVNLVNGGLAKPTFTPPRPFERGVGGRPTLVQNVETLAHVAQIARFGAEWFRELGTVDEPGSMLVTIGGAVARPGVCEVAVGTPLYDAIDAAGGATHDIDAFLVGGYFGTWIPASAISVPLANAALRPIGAALGCGMVHAFPAGHCGLRETSRIARYLAEETAGQCGPCVYGLAAVADSMAGLAAGKARHGTVQRLRRWIGDISGRGACRYPDGAVRFVASALDVFGADLERHANGHACHPPNPMAVLPLPAPARRDWSWQ